MSIATLAGLPIVRGAPVGWTILSGTRPYQRVFEFEATDAARVLELAASRPVELVIDGENNRRVVVKQLDVLGDAVPSSPFVRALLVSDRRWRWTRQHVSRSFNVTARSGERRLILGQLAREQLADDLTFKRWSMNGGRPWRAEEVLEEVLLQVEPDGALQGLFRFDGDVRFLSTVPVQDLELDDAGPEAIARVLALLRGVDLFVNEDGEVIVYSRLSRHEIDAVAAADPAVVGSPLATVVDLSRQRPRAVEVLYDREIEVRFDFDTTAAVQTVTREQAVEPRTLENVLPLPDLSLVVAGRTVAQGTWLTFGLALAAWAADGSSPAGVPIDDGIIRRTWFNNAGTLLFSGALTSVLDAVWARRIAACYAHYRQTFQVSKRWMDRIRSLRAYRVGILDLETGKRAPADAYGDTFVIPTFRGLQRRAAGGGYERFGGNLPTGAIVGAVLENVGQLRPAPADVAVLDEDQGILRVEFKLDRLGLGARIAPSAVEADSVAQVSPEAAIILLDQGVLTAAHRLAVVLTVMQGSPNDERRLHAVRIAPAEVIELIDRDPGTCLGPVWQVRVGGGVLTARFAWRDENAAAVEGAFGVNVAAGAGAPALGDPANADVLHEHARAIAAQVYAGLLDHAEGTHVTVLDPGARPVGRLSAVTHALDGDGRPTTQRDLPPEPPTFNAEALMPDSVRRVIRRLVQP